MSEFMRESYCTYIENALTSLCERLEVRIASNLTDAHVYAETIMVSVLNPTFDLDLRNANVSSPNAPAIDLVDDAHKTIIQVSTDASRAKIQSTLKNNSLEGYTGYHLRFVFLVAKHPVYTGRPFDNPHGVVFDVSEDVFDMGTLMAQVRALHITRLEEAYDGLKREIHISRTDLSKLPRGLASIVGALVTSSADEREISEPVAFRIDEKIRMNSLVRSAREIQELSALTYPLVAIYEEYEREGIGHIRSVFHHLRLSYSTHLGRGLDPDEVFIATIQTVVDELSGVSALNAYTYEDIEFYAAVVVVDAFMRCKVFEGPSVWENR